MNDLRAADSLDESDTAANCAELTAIATDATNILSAISDHCRSTNDELSERLNSTSSMAKDFDGDMQKEAENLKSSLTEKLDALQTMVRTAENKIAQWSKAVAGLQKLPFISHSPFSPLICRKFQMTWLLARML